VKNSTDSTIRRAESNNLEESVYDQANCTCSNALIGAHYTLYYTPQADGTFSTNVMEVDLVILDTLQLEEGFCPNTTDAERPIT